MTKRLSLERFPLHLGRGARAVPQPEFTGMEWFAAYVERNAADGPEARLGVDHQQRRVDAGAGVLERALCQVVPRPAVASGERHEAAALQWSIGTTVTRRPPGQSIVEARSMCLISTP